MAFAEDKVRQVAERVAASSGLEMVELELLGGGKHRMLRVFIDRPGAVPTHDHPDGVTHEDCANFSREFGTILDVEDVMPGGSYELEVSSEGLDSKLSKAAELERVRGHRVKWKTEKTVNNKRNCKGKLEDIEKGKR